MAFPGDYNWKLDITAQATQVDSNESNFPYYFDLSNITSADFWNNVQTDGGDLRVSSDAAGTTQLPLEVVAIDDVAETGEIHFKDSTDSASNKTYYLWWKDTTGTVSQPAVTGTYGRNAVWSAYAAVYHMNDTSGTLTDSTGNNDGTFNGNLPTTTSAQIGNGQSLDGTGDYVDCGDIGAFETRPCSMSAWMKSNSDTATYSAQAEGNNSVNTQFSRITFNNGESCYQARDDAANIFTLKSGTTDTDNTWQYVAGVSYADNDHELYLNGSSVATATTNLGTTTLNNYSIGTWKNTGTTTNDFLGDLDEIRLSNAGLSGGWIKTEYNMQSSNSSFWVEGTPEDLSSTFNITTNAATSVTSTAATLNGTVSDLA